MQVSKKELSATKVELTITLDAAELASYEEHVAAELAQNVTIQGFRKGKAPVELANKHINQNELVNETLTHAVNGTTVKAFVEAKVNPLAMPKIEVKKFVPGQELEYTAVAEFMPEPKLGDYKKLKVKKPEAKVEKSEIEDVVSRIAKSYAEKTVVDRAAAKDDEVKIDFEGKKDGVAFAGGTSKDYTLVLGSNSFIPGFEDGIIGHKAGETFDLELTFPEDYHAEELKGAKTVFTVTLNEVKEVKQPELNADFAKKIDEKFTSMADLEADIEGNLKAQKQASLDQKYQDDLVAAFVKKCKMDIPEILIQDQFDAIKNDAIRNAMTYGMKFEELLDAQDIKEEEWEKEAKEIAKSRAEASVALQFLAKQEGITVTDDAVNEMIEALKKQYSANKEAVKNLGTKQVWENIKGRLIVEETVKFISDAQ